MLFSTLEHKKILNYLVMKRCYNLFFCVIVISVLFCSCNDDDAPFVGDELWECHSEVNWDSTAVINFLIGEFEWEYISCYESRSDANGAQNEGFVIDIKSDNTYRTTRDGQSIKSGTWTIVSATEQDLYQFETDPYIPEAFGRILICEDRIKFDDSYRELCDNYYRKK